MSQAKKRRKGCRGAPGVGDEGTSMVSTLLMGKCSGQEPAIRFPVPPLPAGGRGRSGVTGVVVMMVVIVMMMVVCVCWDGDAWTHPH